MEDTKQTEKDIENQDKVAEAVVADEICEHTKSESDTEKVTATDKNEEPTAKRGILGRKDKHAKKIEELQAALEKVQTEKQELQDKYLRVYSEFDNYRKRTQKEKLDIINSASESLVKSILPIIDDMERAAVYNQKEDAQLTTVIEGEALILQKLLTLLKQKGVTVIDTENQEFTTDLHEAVSMVPAPSDSEKGKILDVVEKGYKLNDKVIRFAKVVIYQ